MTSVDRSLLEKWNIISISNAGCMWSLSSNEDKCEKDGKGTL